MDEETTLRVFAIALMEDRTTVFPGAVAALIDLHNHYGVQDIAKIEKIGLSYQQVWDLYNSTGHSASAMHEKLYREY